MTEVGAEDVTLAPVGRVPAPRNRLTSFMLGPTSGNSRREAAHVTPADDQKRHPWWRVMCLTGVDYFSTLGYQPGIAAVAAGVLSPVATLVLVALTLFGALPVYRAVAKLSPHGQGSIAILERLLPWWQGKLFVLVLLGFALTDYLITITLSAADATAHMIENPLVDGALDGGAVILTSILILALGAVFLRGFTEAIGIAVVLVVVYLSLNAVVIVTSFVQIATNPGVITNWQDGLMRSHPDPLLAVGVALIVFPKLALGMSGFETGVAVMPLVKGDPDDDPQHPAGRIRGTRRMLTTAALIMSGFLITSSFATTLLIPEAAFAEGGEASGRALAYLAHEYLGNVFGTLYDVSTIAILWFAGASAMAGLLNLIPRYLPRYGMAPAWTRAARPLAVLFTVLAIGVTIYFQADVNAQGGAYATGVLALMTSASVAVAISALNSGNRRRATVFFVITAVFVYTTIVNIIERPDGVRIASLFIAGIVIVSILSRSIRAFELRTNSIEFDPFATQLVTATKKPLRIIMNEPDSRDAAEYSLKERQERDDLHIPADDPVLFLEVEVVDASDFEEDLRVVGEDRDGYHVLTVQGHSVPNAVASVLLQIRDMSGHVPHSYFEWSEGNPLQNLVRFLFLGNGETAPVTREILRTAEPDPERRPLVHVG